MSSDWLVMDDPKDNAREPYRARLAGAGRHLPQTRLTTDELMSTTRHNTHIDLERLTGIRERRVSVGDEDSLHPCHLGGAWTAWTGRNATASSLDVVINCSITKFRGGLDPVAGADDEPRRRPGDRRRRTR